MRLSTRGRYATRLLISIAREQSNGPVRKQLLAELEDISPDYVEQILVALKNGGLVNSHRGAKGGFTLAKADDAIVVWDVLLAVEGPLSLAPCLGDSGNCERSNTCVTRGMWKEASLLLQDYFSKIRIRDLVEKAVDLERTQSLMYQI